MQNIAVQLSESDVRDLSKFLASSRRPEGTLSFQELQGFLFAVASCPEMVPPSDWLPIVGNVEDLCFQDQSEAQHIVSLIMTLFNQVNTSVMERSDQMPTGCGFLTDLEANVDEGSTVSQWSRGFLLGNDWLAEVWDELVPDSVAEEYGSLVMVLSFFATRQFAEFYHLEATTTPSRRKPTRSFEEFAETIREHFPNAMVSYAHLGRTISDALEQVTKPRS